MCKVELGKPYRFIFAQPGNDTTILIVIGNTDTQWICWDIYFKMEVMIEKVKIVYLTTQEDLIRRKSRS